MLVGGMIHSFMVTGTIGGFVIFLLGCIFNWWMIPLGLIWLVASWKWVLQD